jgi:hypothetical protein
MLRAVLHDRSNNSTGHFRRMLSKPRHLKAASQAMLRAELLDSSNDSTGHFRRMPSEARHPDSGIASDA